MVTTRCLLHDGGVINLDRVCLYRSNPLPKRLEAANPSKGQGYHVHCPLRPGVVMRMQAAKNFAKALECLRAMYPDGIGGQAKTVFDSAVFPVGPFNKQLLRMPGAGKDGQGLCRLRKVRAAGDPPNGRVELKWHEHYVHGPQYDAEGRERYAVQEMTDCKARVALHGGVDKIVEELARRFMTIDRDDLVDCINSLWKANGLDKLIHSMERSKIAADRIVYDYGRERMEDVREWRWHMVNGGLRLLAPAAQCAKWNRRLEGCLPFCPRYPHRCRSNRSRNH